MSSLRSGTNTAHPRRFSAGKATAPTTSHLTASVGPPSWSLGSSHNSKHLLQLKTACPLSNNDGHFRVRAENGSVERGRSRTLVDLYEDREAGHHKPVNVDAFDRVPSGLQNDARRRGIVEDRDPDGVFLWLAGIVGKNQLAESLLVLGADVNLREQLVRRSRCPPKHTEEETTEVGRAHG